MNPLALEIYPSALEAGDLHVQCFASINLTRTCPHKK